MELFGVTLVGFTAENGRKLVISLVLIAAVMIANRILRFALTRTLQSNRTKAVRFWIRQVVQLVTAIFLVLALLSLWFDDPVRLATAIGLVTAGLAFALQKVVTAVAGYVVLVRGKSFSVGDRIVMGGVRGDVIELTLTQTYIMEMGQPAQIEGRADPAMWVRSRQYTGRIVSVSNARIFDEPVYNFTREFPYLWEELQIPITYKADRARAEQIVLEVARRHSQDAQGLSADDRAELARRYLIETVEVGPQVYWRITDNWLELTARFVCKEHGVRQVKDAMTRDLLAAFDEAGIGIASATVELVGLPAVRATIHADGATRSVVGRRVG